MKILCKIFGHKWLFDSHKSIEKKYRYGYYENFCVRCNKKITRKGKLVDLSGIGLEKYLHLADVMPIEVKPFIHAERKAVLDKNFTKNKRFIFLTDTPEVIAYKIKKADSSNDNLRNLMCFFEIPISFSWKENKARLAESIVKYIATVEVSPELSVIALKRKLTIEGNVGYIERVIENG